MPISFTKCSGYPFKVVNLDEGNISVSAGAVNSVASEIWETNSKPTEVWLKVSLVSETDQSVSTCEVQGTEPTESETVGKLLIANISWEDNTPTISQFVQNSLGHTACGSSHIFYVNG